MQIKFWYYRNCRAILIENDEKNNELLMKVYTRGHIHPITILKDKNLKIPDLLNIVGLDVKYIHDIKEKLNLTDSKKIVIDDYAEIHITQNFERYLNHGGDNFTIL